MLEDAYDRYNRPSFIEPDPLQFVYDYRSRADREIAGLVAASLAFGGVKHILRSAACAFETMGPPRAFVEDVEPAAMEWLLAGFRHRYVTGADLAAMLAGAQQVVARHGSLGAAFAACVEDGDDTAVPALARFVELLNPAGRPNYLLPSPCRKSACKRLFLYLRWMVRKDAVDPGVWRGVPPRLLLVPIDRHMHRIALALGFTQRKTADLRTAMEVTEAFRAWQPDDPVKYDFALTRLGIRQDMDLDAFLRDLALD